MKNFIPFLLIFLIVSCKNESASEGKSDLLGTSFSDYSEIDLLKDYEKISDTSYVKSGYDPTHRITHLKTGKERLILFSELQFNAELKETKVILDTLKIMDLGPNEWITIGYCVVEDALWEEIIAVVGKTNNDTIRDIERAWKADAEAQKIKPIENLEAIFCLNAHLPI